jgi:hypothetical protein
MFVKLNKSWLDKFEHNDYGIDDVPAWWDGNIDYIHRDPSKLYVLSNEYSLEVNKNGNLIALNYGESEDKNNIKEYFLNWKRPTKEEMGYYELVNGYRLPWSEDEPFIWED